jgi:ParB family chromosome partitioning protein
MTSGKKKRMSMLDSLAATGALPRDAPPAPAAAPGNAMMSTNRALRSARDAVDAHHVWELDPADIIDERMADRLDPSDVHDLRDAIEANGQTVPILVRRHPEIADRYLLVYGRRRLEAIRQSDKVTRVRALVASMDEGSAVRAQISENMARRDLSFIERALFAHELVASGFGNQARVAEVFTVTKSSVSMAMAVVEMVGPELISAIGPAHGIGRPRWEALGRGIEAAGLDPQTLHEVADTAWSRAETALATGEAADTDPSVAAFEAVARAVEKAAAPRKPPARPKPARRATLEIGGEIAGVVKRTPKGVSLEIAGGDFADWLEAEAQDLITELHARWQKRAED